MSMGYGSDGRRVEVTDAAEEVFLELELYV